MFEKIIAIGITILGIQMISLYLLRKKEKVPRLEIISNLYLNKEINMDEAEFLMNREYRKIKHLSYISNLLTSVIVCYMFSIPFIITYSNSANKILTAMSLLIEIVVFATIPIVSFSNHEEFVSAIKESNKECIALLKEA